MTVIAPDGSREKLTATEENGRWVTTRRLGVTERAIAARSDVKDAYGNFNGAPAGPIG